MIFFNDNSISDSIAIITTTVSDKNKNDLVCNKLLDELITNCYINMLKNNCSSEKLSNLEVIIKYFNNFGSLTKELIKLIIPKYFSKENTKYYFDIVNRLNTLTNKKLAVIDSIIDEQKKYADDLKITHVDNASKSIFNKEIISLYNIDHKHVEENTSKITKYVPDLIPLISFGLTSMTPGL
jgi:hypothetical protein